LSCESVGDFDSARLVVIWLGANDACLPEIPQHVPLIEYEANLRQMVSMIRARANGGNDIKAVTEVEAKAATPKNGVHILLLTPPPYDGVKWDEHCIQSGRVC
jgi:lysophospholipase L1-like esterase